MEQTLQTLFITQNIFKKLGVDRIGIFGSYARGEKHADIDLLLDEDPGYQKRELLKSIVEKEMNTSCDVVVKNKLEPIILYYINKDLVYVKSR
jgi:predicted nucleotidyltransferase